MPRYHFNVYDGVTAIDKDGSQLPDIEAAQSEAMRFASELLRSDSAKAKLGEDWHVEVTDGRGMILFRIDIAMSASPAVGTA